MITGREFSVSSIGGRRRRRRRFSNSLLPGSECFIVSIAVAHQTQRLSAVW